MRRILNIAAAALLVLVAPLAAVPSWDFPPPRPFTGSAWRNPYEGWQGGFKKVNLHAHSRAWGGLTSGASSAAELAEVYAAQGFDALAISNYFQLTKLEQPPLSLVRGWEHGLNLTKAHRLVLGTDEIVPIDFPISTRATRQWVLNMLGGTGALVGLNHPSLRGGHDCEEVEALTGFQLFEVHNAYATSHFEWDCALTAGRLAWAMGNDDSHSAAAGIGIAWNMVGAETAAEGPILSALGSGRSYVVRGEGGRMDVEVQRLSIEGDGVVLVLSAPASSIEWITDGGQRRQLDRDTASSRFVPGPEHHYVRAVVRTPITELVLNPLVREGAWSAPRATIAWPRTIGSWALWLAAAVFVAWLTRPRRTLSLVPRERRAA
ncbi:MAG: hypothetical protein JNJ54_23295 [Myxococcaceae bacterium]|nr:hypothetical protein [Myxococcaceae bacterium]